MSEPVQETFDYSGVPAQGLEALRMRLAQLTHSLAKLKEDLMQAQLPQWSSLQSQLNVILTQLSSLTFAVSHFESELNSTIVYPLPTFPTTQQEGLVTTLLRKKYLPEVQEWITDSQVAEPVDYTRDTETVEWCLSYFSQERSNYNLTFQGEHVQRQRKKPFNVEDVLKFVHKGTIS